MEYFSIINLSRVYLTTVKYELSRLIFTKMAEKQHCMPCPQRPYTSIHILHNASNLNVKKKKKEKCLLGMLDEHTDSFENNRICLSALKPSRKSFCCYMGHYLMLLLPISIVIKISFYQLPYFSPFRGESKRNFFAFAFGCKGACVYLYYC